MAANCSSGLYASRIRAFFRHYLPEKLVKAEVAIERYKGQEAEFLAAMVHKFGPEPHTLNRYGFQGASPSDTDLCSPKESNVIVYDFNLHPAAAALMAAQRRAGDPTSASIEDAPSRRTGKVIRINPAAQKLNRKLQKFFEEEAKQRTAVLDRERRHYNELELMYRDCCRIALSDEAKRMLAKNLQAYRKKMDEEIEELKMKKEQQTVWSNLNRGLHSIAKNEINQRVLIQDAERAEWREVQQLCSSSLHRAIVVTAKRRRRSEKAKEKGELLSHEEKSPNKRNPDSAPEQITEHTLSATVEKQTIEKSQKAPANKTGKPNGLAFTPPPLSQSPYATSLYRKKQKISQKSKTPTLPRL